MKPASAKPKKKPLTRPQLRARAMQVALGHPDPWVASELEKKFIETHIPSAIAVQDYFGVRHLDTVWRESPLQATYRFAEEYRAALKDPSFRWKEGSAKDPGPVWEWSLEDMRNVWVARQTAEALRIPFEQYAWAICDAHYFDGFIPPRPRDMQMARALMHVAPYVK